MIIIYYPISYNRYKEYIDIVKELLNNINLNIGRETLLNIKFNTSLNQDSILYKGLTKANKAQPKLYIYNNNITNIEKKESYSN